ncbi:hypothetical protein DSO57_1015015 [Entomophthora muscae]|uniref:Uncharacterized protein n=1 Tax=Entomophthora muscae TaxID=34485 RepID=A0ACC2S768_9FUNG|nr:hypothetical protein DSO57_1015015 [Entomophthora muscae]
MLFLVPWEVHLADQSADPCTWPGCSYSLGSEPQVDWSDPSNWFSPAAYQAPSQKPPVLSPPPLHKMEARAERSLAYQFLIINTIILTLKSCHLDLCPVFCLLLSFGLPVLLPAHPPMFFCWKTNQGRFVSSLTPQKAWSTWLSISNFYLKIAAPCGSLLSWPVCPKFFVELVLWNAVSLPKINDGDLGAGFSPAVVCFPRNMGKTFLSSSNLTSKSWIAHKFLSASGPGPICFEFICQVSMDKPVS